MIRYERLWPPPLCSGRTSDFSGSDRVISAKSETLAPRRPGVVGLYLRIAMSAISQFLPGYAGAPNRSIGLLPGASVTIARLVPLRLPKLVRVRLRLPCRLAVFTDATLTLKIRSTALLIGVLLESGCTTNVYTLSSISAYDFSEMTGDKMMSRGSVTVAIRPKPPRLIWHWPR